MITRRRFNVVNAKARRRMLIFYIGTILLSCSIIPASLDVITVVVAQPFPTTPSSPATTGLPTIQITFIQEGQQLPPGELTIEGISSDDQDADCEVFADVNDISPMQNVTAAGDSEEEEDLSKWTFTYSQDYQLIIQGENELTAKYLVTVTQMTVGGLNIIITSILDTFESPCHEFSMNKTGYHLQEGQ